ASSHAAARPSAASCALRPLRSRRPCRDAGMPVKPRRQSGWFVSVLLTLDPPIYRPRQHAQRATGFSGLAARPSNMYFAVLHDAVAQVHIDETLIWNSRFVGHALEVRHDVFRKTHGDRL